MGKASNRKKLQRKEPPAGSAPQVTKLTRAAKIRRLVGVLVTTIGLVSAYVTIFGYVSPRISVQPVAAGDPTDPTTTVFSVTNLSSLDIRDVIMSSRFINFYVRYYGPGEVAIRKREGNEIKVPEVGDIHEFAPVDGFYRTIPPQRSGTMKVPFGPPQEDLDIEIVIRYRPAWYFFSRREVFRFVSKRSANGEVYWLPQPNEGLDPYLPRTPDG